jgi:flagellar motor component MotA
MTFFWKKHSDIRTVDEMILFCRLYPMRSPQTETVIAEAKHPFMKESLRLLMEGILDERGMERVLAARIKSHFHKKMKWVHRISALARWVTAFGLCGAAWFLSSGDWTTAGYSILGSLFVSHFVLFPFADWQVRRLDSQKRTWNMIAQGVRLALLKTNPVAVAEELNSHLAPEDRIRWVAMALPSAKKAA